MEVTMFEIEEWWRHLGCYDRKMIIGGKLRFADTCQCLIDSDNWWDNLTDADKRKVYEDFFDEN